MVIVSTFDSVTQMAARPSSTLTSQRDDFSPLHGSTASVDSRIVAKISLPTVAHRDLVTGYLILAHESAVKLATLLQTSYCLKPVFSVNIPRRGKFYVVDVPFLDIFQGVVQDVEEKRQILSDEPGNVIDEEIEERPFATTHRQRLLRRVLLHIQNFDEKNALPLHEDMEL